MRMALTTTIALGLLAAACSNMEPSYGRRGTDKPASSNASPICKTPAANAVAKTALNLLAAPNYEDDIAPVVQASCNSCHGEGGTASPTFATYDNVKNNIDAMVLSVTRANNPMPPGGGFASTTLLQNFKNAGAPQNKAAAAAGGASTLGPAEQAGTAGAGDGTAGSSDAAGKLPTDALPQQQASCLAEDSASNLIAKSWLDKCHATGFVFDRTTAKCSTTDHVSTYPCDHDGIVVAFRQAGFEIDGRLTAALADGYELDQCVEGAEGKPMRILLRKIALAKNGKWGVLVRALSASE